MCLGVFLLGFILPETLCDCWTWLPISFLMVGKFSATISSNIISGLLFLSSLSGLLVMQILVHLTLSQRSFRLSSFIFIHFSIFCSVAVIFTILSTKSCNCSSASVILLLIAPSVFVISFSCSLVLGLWYTFLTSSLFSQDPGSASLSLFWFIFLEDCLSPLPLVAFPGFYLVPLFGT